MGQENDKKITLKGKYRQIDFPMVNSKKMQQISCLFRKSWEISENLKLLYKIHISNREDDEKTHIAENMYCQDNTIC